MNGTNPARFKYSFYFWNQKFKMFEGMDLNGKSNCLRTSGHCSQSNKHNFDLIKIDKNGIPKANQNKAGCLTTGGHSCGNHSDMDLLIVAQRGRKPENPKSRKAGLATEQQLEPRFEGKTNCLTSVQKDNLLLIGGIKNGQFQEGTSSDFSQGARVYSTEGESTCLSSEGGGMGTHLVLFFLYKYYIVSYCDLLYYCAIYNKSFFNFKIFFRQIRKNIGNHRNCPTVTKHSVKLSV